MWPISPLLFLQFRENLIAQNVFISDAHFLTSAAHLNYCAAPVSPIYRLLLRDCKHKETERDTLVWAQVLPLRVCDQT